MEWKGLYTYIKLSQFWSQLLDVFVTAANWEELLLIFRHLLIPLTEWNVYDNVMVRNIEEAGKLENANLLLDWLAANLIMSHFSFLQEPFAMVPYLKLHSYYDYAN